jgi:hypothetical protein
MLMKSVVFWVITRHRVVIIYQLITTRCRVITQKTTDFTKVSRCKMVEGKGLLGRSRCSRDDNIKMTQINRIVGPGLISYSIKCCKNLSE